MRISSKLLCFIIIYLIYLNKWVIADPTDTLASGNPSHQEDGNQKTGGSDGGLTVGEEPKPGSLANPELKLFKDDGNGNKAEIRETDFTQIKYSGYFIYEFKPNVHCTLVKVEEKDVWKKGDQGVDIPISVSYNPDTHKVVVFKCRKSVFYKRDNTGNWVHYHTIESQEQDNSAKTSGDSSGSNASKTVSILSSIAEHETASTDAPEPAESSGEAEEPSTVAPEATDANEVSKHTGLRGTSPPTDTKEEADETASSTSGGAVTSEEKEKDSEDQEAGSDDGSFSPVPAEASESTDPGSTAGEGKVAQELAEGSTAQTSGGASQSGEENEEVDEAEGSQGGGVTAQTEADGGSSTDTSTGEGTGSADASADKGSGEGTGTADGSAHTGGEGGDGASESSSSDLNIKFFAKDSSDANNYVELDSTKYNKKDINATRIDYELKTEVKCTLIKINNKELWKHGDYNCNENLKNVSYRNQITLVLNVGDAFLRYDKNSKGDWYYDHTSKPKSK